VGSERWKWEELNKNKTASAQFGMMIFSNDLISFIPNLVAILIQARKELAQDHTQGRTAI
jgi:hypothetical protein